MMTPTHYRHPAVRQLADGKTIATCDIPEGTMIHVLSVIKRSVRVCAEYLATHPDFAAQLSGTTPLDKALANRIDLTSSAAETPSDLLDKEMFLCQAISMYQHSCDPNTNSLRCQCIVNGSTAYSYFVVAAARHIAAGDDVTIMHGYDKGHRCTDDVLCKCGLSTERRRRRWLEMKEWFEGRREMRCLIQFLVRSLVFTRINK